MGQQPIMMHIPMLNMVLKKKKKICERLGLDCDDKEKMKENMKAMVNDDEGLCCMTTWKMCLFDKNGDMCLDMNEFKTMIEAMGKMCGKEFDEEKCKNVRQRVR